MSKKSVAVRVTLLSATLAPALALGVVQDADAGTISKNGCTVTPYAPTPIYAYGHARPVAAQYRVRVTCNPHATISLRQVAWEQDRGYPDHVDDQISRRTGGYVFNHTSGWRTKVFHWRVAVPNTEAGREEYFQKVSFRVSHGHGYGSWSAWTASPITSFPN